MAVLDTGVDDTHPDLEGRVLPGWDFVNNDDDFMDDHPDRHGTRVAGIIAANTNNLLGIAGMDWNCKILPLKVLDNEGGGSTESVAAAIRYAVKQGADVINMSYGASSLSSLEREAIWEAYEAGVILVAASGNNASAVMYLAAYSPVISVGSTGQSDQVSSFSCYGKRLDLVAPGEDILSTGFDGGYDSGNGTSFSAPVVSGIAALMLGYNDELNSEQLEWMMEQTALSLTASGERDDYSGYGRVQPLLALQADGPDLSADVGNEKELATPLRLNVAVAETMDLPMEDDWFVIDIDHTMVLDVSLSSPSRMDMVVWIEKDEGEPPWEKEYDAVGEGGNEKFCFTTDAGRYYLNVYEYNGHWSEASYEIKVSGFVPVETVQLDQHEVDLLPDETVRLQAGVLPDNASNAIVSWQSSDADIAWVYDGIVSAVKPGTVLITASVGEFADQCVVNVKPAPVSDLHLLEASAEPGGYSIVLLFDENLSKVLSDTIKQQIQLSRGDAPYAPLADRDIVTVDEQRLIVQLQQSLSSENNYIKVAEGMILNLTGDRSNVEIQASLPVDEGCFIATAAFGSYLDSHVQTLRVFRDEILLNSAWGSWFVEQYYRFSPPIAGMIVSHPIWCNDLF
ncbi:MAG: S8 family serine peptidase [Bacillota bacterium]|nr:S8 family serine peptidase [Bacillota bacterium]